MEYLYSPYSYSKQESYYSCPNKFKLMYIDKIKGVSENKALEKGTYIHLFLEKNISPSIKNINELNNFKFRLLDETEQQEIKKLCAQIKETDYFKKLFKIVKNAEIVYTEFGFSFDKNFNTIPEYKRTKDILISGYIDLLSVNGKNGLVLDYKTGKTKGQYQTYTQTELYALFMFKQFNLEKVKCIYYYVEHDVVYTKEYTSIEIPVLQNKFKDLLLTIENTTHFKKKITKLCNWCDFLKSGHCVLSDEELLSVV